MKYISIGGVCHIQILDNNEMELTFRSNDTEIHNGILNEITVDENDDTFTVTYETL